MNNAVFGKGWKMWENIEILNWSQQKKKKLFGVRTKLSYYKVFHKNVLALEMKKIFLVLSISELSKKLMYELDRPLP